MRRLLSSCGRHLDDYSWDDAVENYYESSFSMMISPKMWRRRLQLLAETDMMMLQY